MMDFEKIKTYMRAIKELPKDKPHNTYELVIYSDGSGHFGIKNGDRTLFTFASDESLGDKFKECLTNSLRSTKGKG